MISVMRREFWTTDEPRRLDHVTVALKKGGSRWNLPEEAARELLVELKRALRAEDEEVAA
jgi:hypothetical protein